MAFYTHERHAIKGINLHDMSKWWLNSTLNHGNRLAGHSPRKNRFWFNDAYDFKEIENSGIAIGIWSSLLDGFGVWSSIDISASPSLNIP